MKKSLLGFALALLLAGCSTGVQHDNNSSPSPTPTVEPSAAVDLTLTGVNFGEHSGYYAVVRVVQGTNIIACSEAAQVEVTGGFTVSFPDALEKGETYTVEIYANLDSVDLTYNSGDDRTYRVDLVDVADDVSLTVDTAGGEQGIGWPNRTACPL